MKVLNKRTDKILEGAIYVGRPSKWGNPFTIGKDGDRNEVIFKYQCLLFESEEGASMLSWLDELKGKDLICWCSPLPCHADVLLELANKKETASSP